MSAAAAPTVFIVDDDEPVRDSLKLLLESHFLAVRDYGSCSEFLEAFRPGEPGCLLLDLHLPVIGGLEFLKAFGDRLQELPVILITGHGDATTRSRALEQGVEAFLEKPIDDGELLETIRQAIDHRARLRK